MYNLLFWDWIPTVAVHKYYCSTQAGFWVYKTAEEWKAENPGVLETLIPYEGKQLDRIGDMDNYQHAYHLNQRFDWVVKHNGKYFINLWRHEQEIIDTKNNEVLARYIDFSTSELILQKGKKGNLARDVAIYLSREMIGESGVALGQHFGISGAGVTVRHGIIANKIKKDRKL